MSVSNASSTSVLPVPETKAYPVVVDNGPYASLLDSNKFAHLQRLGNMFSASTLVPAHLQGKSADCTILVEMALRLNQNPLAFLQKCYVVHGKPGMEAQLVIALMNVSGLFKDPIDYEVEGKDPKDPNYRVRAFAVRKSTGKTIYGPWVDWPTVKSEGWLDKSGSKWKTMPALMFMYRAAAWFSRAHCPEATMGMMMVEELRDIGPEEEPPRKNVTPTSRTSELVAELASRDPVSTPVREIVAEATTSQPEETQDTERDTMDHSATADSASETPATTQPEPTGGITPAEELAIKMSEVYGIDQAAAEKSLDAFCRKMLKKSLAEASNSKMITRDLINYIKAKSIPVTA